MTLLRCSLRNCAPQFALSLLVLSSVLLYLHHTRSRAYSQIITPSVTVVSAASLEETAVAPDSIAVAFMSLPGVVTASASSLPLPTALSGVTVRLRDSAGVTRDCGLFFVSAQQINFLIPSVTATGAAEISIRSQTTVLTGSMQISRIAPGLFSANATGQGAAIGFLLIAPQQGAQVYEPLMQFDQQKRQFVPRPILLARENIQAESLFFVFYGTGLRARGEGSSAIATIGGIRATAAFAGAIPGFLGLDQINLPIDASMIPQLTGRGRVSVALSIRDNAGTETTSNAIEIEVADRAAPSTLSITGVQPARALAGETITIQGTGFATSIEANRVRISGSEAQIIESTATQLKAIVPFGAETGPVTVSAGQGEAVSLQPLTIRTSISGIIEDTLRRPIQGVTVNLLDDSSFFPVMTAKTNKEGVFLLPDVPENLRSPILFINSDGITPQLPQIEIEATITPRRDHPLPRPVSLQIPIDNGLRPVTSGTKAPGDVTTSSAEIKTPQLNEPGQIACNLGQGLIGLQSRQPLRRCETTQECLSNLDSVYFYPIAGGRAPVRLPSGHFSSTMVQITPFNAYFQNGASLVFPNTDCLPPGPARVFAFSRRGLALLSQSQAPGAQSRLGTFYDFAEAIVAPDGQSISMPPGVIFQGGIFFVSARRATATVTGRVLSPEPTGAGGRPVLRPVRGAVVIGRGQDAITDGNGAFVLRNVPVLRANDSLTIETSYLRPNGRVERGSHGNFAITADGTVVAGDLTLPAAANRPPSILATSNVTTKAGERTDLNLLISDPDAGQTVKASITGPAFGSLIDRGDGAYTLRLAPGAADVGLQFFTINATDNQGEGASKVIDVLVRGTAANQPPIANAVAVATDEDIAKSFALAGSDPNGDALRFMILTQPAHGQLIGTAPDLIYQPNENYFGADSFTFKVNDGLIDSAPATVSITVAPINDAPRLNMPIEQKIAAGQELKFQITASDPDPGDRLAITATNLPAGATLLPAPDPQGGAALFTWTPTQAQIGTSIVTFSVADNANPPLNAQRPLAITAAAANAASNVGMWTPTAGPIGGAISAFFARGATVLAASPIGAVNRSTNNGETWTALPASAFGNSPVGAFAAVGTTILANTGRGFYRSTDDGITWAPSSPRVVFATVSTGGVSVEVYSTALAVRGSVIFGTYANLLFASSDGGVTWTNANTGLPELLKVLSVAASGTSVLAFVEGRGVFRSIDDGKNWTLSSEGLPTSFTGGEFFTSGSTTYLVLGNLGGALGGGVGTTPNVYASNDNGQSWASVNLPTDVYPVRKMIFTADQWIASNSQKVFSLARQANQSITATMLLETPFVNAVGASEGSLFAGTLLDGVFRSSDKGANWQRRNSGLSAMRVNAVLSSGSNLFAATSAGFFSSADQGQTWQSGNTGFANALSQVLSTSALQAFVSPVEITAIASLPATSGPMLFAAQRNASLYRSSDLGKTWEKVEGLPDLGTVSTLGVNGTALFAGLNFRGLPTPGQGPLYRSTDFGKSWASLTGLPSGKPTAFTSVGSNLFVAIDDRVYLSTNNGETWQSASTGLPAALWITALAAGGSNLYAGTYGKGIFVTSNNGQSWSALTTNLPKDAAIRNLYADGANVFAVSPTEYDTLCTTGGFFFEGRCFGGLFPGFRSPIDFDLYFTPLGPGKIYFSPNQGQNWAPIGAGLNAAPMISVGGSGGTIFAGSTGSGVFSRKY